jgi:protein-L-isoaspartate(D-aspartate) O-methyltransferase
MPDLDEAFRKFPRKDFLPKIMKPFAKSDEPLRIGHGQTNSQPSLVRQMLKWLDPQPGDRILDVGSGSGWTTAILAHLTGLNGEVFAVEKVPELVEHGQENARAAGVTNLHFSQAGDELGLPEHAPYDRILVSASASELPKSLFDQLKPGGKMVIPVKNDILEVTKKPSGVLDVLLHAGYVFVPLV